jgi:hypothetical protein
MRKSEFLCNDNILKSLITMCVSVNMPIHSYVVKTLKIFENLLKDPSNLNVSIRY